MELKDRIIAAKCENDPAFRERYLLAQVKPLAVVQDLMRRGCTECPGHTVLTQRQRWFRSRSAIVQRASERGQRGGRDRLERW